MLGVYTVGCVNSLKVNFFRYVAMNHHIKSVHFTTKIRKIRNIWPCFSNSGDNTVVSQLCNYSCKTTLRPPKQFSCLYLCTHTQLGGMYRVTGTILLCMHSQLGGIYRVTILPPSPDYSLISLLCTWSVNMLHVSSITHLCGIFARITIL